MEKENTRSILLLLKQFGFTDKTLEQIYLNENQILEVIFDKSHPLYNKYFEIYTSKEKEISRDISVLQDFSEIFIEKMKQYKHLGIKVYFKYSPDYPKHLFNTTEPLFIYCYGNLELLSSFYRKVAIIGTRKASNEGKLKTIKHVKRYVEENWVTVSGLAKGIDTIVHKETIENDGKTIAVIPSSFEKVYPAENIPLFDEIIKKDGLAITMVGPFENTYKSNFLDRNSIVAKLCEEILMLEASIKSGTLNTVRKGFELNKRIYYDSSLIDEEVVEYVKKFGALDINKRGGES